MCQHVSHRCAIRANKMEAGANSRSRYEAPPSLADMHDLKTPTCLVQIRQRKRIIMCFKYIVWIEIEVWYVVVEVVHCLYILSLLMGN